MKKITLLAIISTLIFTACHNENHYVENSFFDGKLLKNEEISDLPDPLGNALLYFKGYGVTNPRAYIDSSMASSDQANMYAYSIYNYLKEKSFKYLYTVSGTNMYNTPDVSKYSYNLKESSSFTEFMVDEYYSGGSVINNPWVFVFSNGDFVENDHGDKCLESAHCIIISKEAFCTYEYNEKTINYTYFVELDTHSIFWHYEA